MAYDLTLFEGGHGILWAFKGTMPTDPVAAMQAVADPSNLIYAGNPDPSVIKLLAASGLMYKLLAQTSDMLESLVLVLEQRGADDMVESVQNVASNLKLACRLADEGSAKVFPQ
jgi:hypothetical protein